MKKGIFMGKTTSMTMVVAMALATTACQQAFRPEFTPINDTLSEAMANPQIDTPIVIAPSAKPEPGSLWQPGSRHFFKDSRANQVGDILTILVEETAEANTEANTETTREYTGKSELLNLLNFEGKLVNHGIQLVDDNLLDTDSSREFAGEGSTDRSDSVTATIAAVVTQVLPNGYLVIQGSRQVVVNYEMQELQIKGIVRPEDISSGNTVASNKIAEARVFYAGKGMIDESQSPHYGVRFIDKIMPF